MPNISGIKFFVTLVLFAGILGPQAFAGSPAEALQKAVVDKFEQTAKPIFGSDAAGQKGEVKTDPFYDKINKKRTEFSEKQLRRRKDFMQKIQSRNLTDEEKLQKITNFNHKEIARRKKFAEKQQAKIDARNR